MKNNLDEAVYYFIRAYIDEVNRIKKKGTRKQKLKYLFRKQKNLTLKDVYELIYKKFNK